MAYLGDSALDKGPMQEDCPSVFFNQKENKEKGDTRTITQLNIFFYTVQLKKLIEPL